MTKKEEFMQDDLWGPCDGSSNRARGQGDVRVRIIKGGYTSKGERRSLAFRFIDGAEAKIGNCNYANFRLIDKKIYFRPEREGKGYKISRSASKGGNCELKATIGDVKKWAAFDKSCFNLLYDRDLELYYIEADKRL